MVFIFDMDGVLVDNINVHQKAWIEFGKRLNYSGPPVDAKKFFGMTNARIFKSLTGDTLSNEEIDRLSAEKESVYREIYEPEIMPLKGLKEFLNHLKKAGCKTAVATAGPRKNVDFVIEKCGLQGLFDAITDDSEVLHGKPDPEVYLLTAQKLNVDPAECTVFEDSFAGIESASRAGMRVIGVSTTNNREQLLAATHEVTADFDLSNTVIAEILESLKQ